MKKSFFTHKRCLVFFLSFTISVGVTYCVEKNNEEIVINQKFKSLISPEGESYIWFFEGEVIAQTREIKAIESGTYSVKISNGQNDVVEKSIKVIVDENGIRKIHIISDSTVSTYGSDKYPQTGWGQVLQLYFDDTKIQINNHAIGGRSSRKFYQEGRWAEVQNVIDSNDFVFIQFGHNDRDYTKEDRYTDTTDYKEYLRIYVNDSRSAGAIPVLISPMIMNAYNGTTLRNVFTEGENNYRGAMLHVAQELDVLFIDLNMRSFESINEAGRDYSTWFLFFGLAPGEYPNFPDGMGDGTHFQEMGALEMCNLIKDGINDWEVSDSKTTLVNALNPTYKVTVDYENTKSGIATLTGFYPENTPITLKTIMNNGNTFKRWLDGSGNLVTENTLYQFIMEAKEYTFKPIVSDCNSTEEGTASYDKCGSCTGGTTGKDPCVSVFESERSCEYDGKYGTVSDGDKTRGIVNTANYSNPAIIYGIKTEIAGKYEFGIVYSGTDTEETVTVYVNDELAVEPLKLQNDGNWNTTIISIDLAVGTNFVKIVSSASTGSTKFDFLSVYSEGLEKSCDVEAISKMNFPANSVYPNPFSHSLHIDLGSAFNYEVLDLTGKTMLSGNCQLSCSVGENLERGIYLLRILQDKHSVTGLIEKL